jgi:hypothetical protein
MPMCNFLKHMCPIYSPLYFYWYLFLLKILLCLTYYIQFVTITYTFFVAVYQMADLHIHFTCIQFALTE